MEMLIYLRANPDSASWTRGMIVAAHEDGWPWGREESKQVWIAEGRAAADWPKQGHWCIVRLPNVQLAEMAPYLQPDMVAGGRVKPTMGARRKFTFDYDKLPVAVHKAIERDGEITLHSTVQQIKALVKNRLTGVYEA